MEQKYKDPKLNELFNKLDKKISIISSLEKVINGLNEEKEEIIAELRQNTYRSLVEYEVGFNVKDNMLWYPRTSELPFFNKEFIETKEEAENYIADAKKKIQELIGKEVTISNIKHPISTVNIILAYIKKGDEEPYTESSKRNVR